MPDREKVVKGMKCCRWGFCFACPYNDGVHGNTGCKKKLVDDALELLNALDVTPEELERLKKCRHECKIDCLLEHYDAIKAERDALLEKQEPRLMVAKDFEDNPNVDGYGYLPCWIECNEIEVERAIRFGAIQEGETLDGWTEVSKAELLPTDLSYNPNVRHWTARPSEEQRRKTPWPDA